MPKQKAITNAVYYGKKEDGEVFRSLVKEPVKVEIKLQF